MSERLTSAQKAAATRAKNKEAKAREIRWKAEQAAAIAVPASIETYGNPLHDIRTRVHGTACMLYTEICVRKYRITVELVEEPAEVLHKRLLDLWRTTERNQHRWDLMRTFAREIGMDPALLVVSEQGSEHRRGGQ